MKLRDRILELLKLANRPLSGYEIDQIVRPRIFQSVYEHLHLLEHDGLIRYIKIDDGSKYGKHRYEIQN